MTIDRDAFDDFTSRWLRKSERYRGPELSHCFDRFFTLYVVYNRGYDEAARFVLLDHPAAFPLWRIRGRREEPAIASKIPERIRATTGVCAFCGASLRSDVLARTDVQEALRNLEAPIVQGRFYITANRHTGIPDREADRNAFHEVRNGRLFGLLGILYQLRCNLFHGQKEYHGMQQAILEPANVVLDRITRHLVEKVLERANRDTAF